MLALSGVSMAQTTKVIAHRGFWDTEGSAQNSIASLTLAAEAGVYGSEFDVQLTKDNVPVVNHDDSIAGLLIVDTPYAELKDIKLKNGESLPTLRRYLEEGRKLNIQMILELKPLRSKEAEDKAVELTVAMVKELGMESRVDYISFSMNICEQLVKAAPNANIAYLMSDIEPSVLKDKGINGIDYLFVVLLSDSKMIDFMHERMKSAPDGGGYMGRLQHKPEWIDDAHQLGMTVNAWTVNDEEALRDLIAHGVDFITTDRPAYTLQLTKEQNP